MLIAHANRPQNVMDLLRSTKSSPAPSTATKDLTLDFNTEDQIASKSHRFQMAKDTRSSNSDPAPAPNADGPRTTTFYYDVR